MGPEAHDRAEDTPGDRRYEETRHIFFEWLLTHVEFRERKGDTSKIISFFAKRARGAMAHYVIRNRIGDVEGTKAFDLDGYRFDTGRSTPDTFVFLRDQET